MIQYKKDTDNIVTLTLNMKGRLENVINHKIGEAFRPVIRHLQQEKARGALRGIILTSGKKTFLAGGDLEYLYRADDAREIFQAAEQLKQIFRDLESPGVPVVAALNGTAVGAGFELALACHHRIAVDSPRVRLGLPEVGMGLIPSGGGIVRLMWLLGIEKAFPVLTSGRDYSPREALSLGIIDELAADRAEMLDQAKTWLLQNREGRRPWDQEGCTIPGGTARRPRLATHIQSLAVALASDTHHNFPAPQGILNVLAEGSKVDFDTACRIESRYYTGLVRSRTCKNMIKAFWFDYNYIRQGNNRPRGFGRFRPRKVGIIGAGLMGSGIAFACLMHGLEVIIKDVSRLIAERGRTFVTEKLTTLVASGHLQADEKEDILRRITTTETPRAFETCDLVIEAVFENAMVKQKVTREAEEYMDDYSLLASNTISIPITRLAETSTRPEHYVGLHFFHPAEEVPLVEIVRGSHTSDETVARAFDFVQTIGKIPIVVKDDWGFYAARVQNTFILEGITMLKEGYPPALIENLSRQAGMPKGALYTADELGLSIVLRYEHQAAEHYGPKYIQHPAVSVLDTMIGELDRNGRQRNAGFYEYEDHDERRLWSGLTEHFPVSRRSFNPDELIERFLFAQVIEAVWCMQEKVIQSVAAANLGSLHGWGFPAFKGGVIQYVNDYGPEQFIEKCGTYEKKFGQRFRVPTVLRKLVD